MKTLRVAICGLFALALACGTLSAQQTIRVTPSPNVTIDQTIFPATTVTLFSNLGFSPTDNYFDANGWLVTGPTQGTYSEQWVAAKFQAKKASHVTSLQVAVGVLAAGPGQKIDVAIYNDDGTGQVGTILSPVVVVHTIPTFGTCCSLATATFTSPGISILANTNYWAVVTSDTSDPTLGAAWAFSNLGLPSFNEAEAGWAGNAGAEGAPALAVKGTVP